eukprot:8104979-Pyramimonas_sp.AAC.1
MIVVPAGEERKGGESSPIVWHSFLVAALCFNKGALHEVNYKSVSTTEPHVNEPHRLCPCAARRSLVQPRQPSGPVRHVMRPCLPLREVYVSRKSTRNAERTFCA